MIANLNQLTSLTKLQLCNNVIKKIQNLDVLVNLVWLDLSFNSIKTIEGLDKLVKLEVLDLHRNFIRRLENMDNNLRLQMLHISTNKLDDLENVCLKFLYHEIFQIKGNSNILKHINACHITKGLRKLITFFTFKAIVENVSI